MYRNLTALAEHVGPEVFLDLMAPLSRWLPRSPDPDLALNNLERVLAQPAGRAQLPAIIEGRGRNLLRERAAALRERVAQAREHAAPRLLGLGLRVLLAEELRP